MKQFLLLITLLFSQSIFSQKEIEYTPEDFKLTGDAVKVSDNCFKLTDPKEWKGGTVYYKSSINLKKSFEMEMDIHFGCSDFGADGIVFIFHDKLKTGFEGGAMGFGGLVPSFGIEMDTYQNFEFDDPQYDHLALVRDGRVHHRNSLSSVVPILSNKKNFEDCAPHRFKVRWFADSKIIQVSIDGTLRMNKKYDLVKKIFNGNPNVYWGFTAATGSKYNLQQVCLEKLEFAKSSIFDKDIKQKLLDGTPHDMENVDFISGKTELDKDAFDELDKLVALLNEKPNLEIYINGHTDSSGPAGENKRLSKKRADIVRKYLIDNGITGDRVHTFGSGESFPKTSNATPNGRKINRRIEVYLIDPRA